MDQEKLKKKSEERLAELQKIGRKAAEGCSTLGGSLHYDLLLLLRNDPEIRDAILAVLKPDEKAPDENAANRDDEAFANTPQDEAIDEDAAPRMASDIAPTSEYPTFARQARLLQLVEVDPVLRNDWLLDLDKEWDAKLIRLIAFSAQWDALLQLWERLAERCKQEQRALSSNEHEILNLALANHNLIWRGKQAEFVGTVSGTDFDHKKHERGNAQGNRVVAQWQPGLLNAAKALIKKPLVKTE